MANPREPRRASKRPRRGGAGKPAGSRAGGVPASRAEQGGRRDAGAAPQEPSADDRRMMAERLRASGRELTWAAAVMLAAVVVTLGLFREPLAPALALGGAVGLVVAVRVPGKPRARDENLSQRVAERLDRQLPEQVRLLRQPRAMLLACVPLFAVAIVFGLVAAVARDGWTAIPSPLDFGTASVAEALLGCGQAVCAARAAEYRTVREAL